jgi:signal transduction histidine kinase
MAGVPVDVRFEPELLPPGFLEPELEIDVYRIVQEAVGNAARHSHARRIWIAAHIVDDSVRLVVGDDGVGFDEGARERGLGLDGMQERASIHGLAVEIRSRRGDGTRVEIVVPIKPPPPRPGLQFETAPTGSR